MWLILFSFYHECGQILDQGQKEVVGSSSLEIIETELGKT